MKFNGTHWLTGTGKEFPFDPNGLKPEEQAYSFGVSKEDSLKIKEWIASHDPHLRSSTFGGAFTYLFTPTSIGTISTVRCDGCGGEFDFSHTDEW